MLLNIYIAFSYEREMIVYLYQHDFSKGKGSSLQFICNAHTAFLLCRADIQEMYVALPLMHDNYMHFAIGHIVLLH